MKSSILSLGQTYLLAILASTYPTIGQELQRLSPADAQSRLSDGNAYIRKEITGGGGMFPLLESSTLEVVGTSSFKGKALASGVKMALTHIRLSFSQVDPANAVPPAGQSYGNKYTDIDPALRAAHLVLVKDGKRFIDKPISEFLSLGNQQGMVGVDDAYELDAYRYLEGDQEIDIYINFPTNLNLTTGKKTFVNVELIGPRVMA